MELHTPWLFANFILFVFGFWVLIKGSDFFVDASSDLARHWKMSEIAIGLTFVSLGTALPELASSVYAAICNEPDFVIGNVTGSITTNITLVLGIGVFCCGRLTFPRALLTRDAVLMNLVFIVTIIMFFISRALQPDGKTVTFGLDRWCGLLLLIGAFTYCLHHFFMKDDACEGSEHAHKKVKRGVPYLLLLALFSLVMITLGSKLLVDNAVWVAEELGISHMVISATVVAFGGSVPELAVTIMGVRKCKHGLALGNIIGSCIFNVLLIFGACSIIRPIAVIGYPGIVSLGIMFSSGIILFLLMLLGKKRLRRSAGFMLLAFYLLFLAYNGRDFFLR